MARLRVARAGLVEPPVPPHLRVVRAGVAGDVVVPRRLRVARLGVTGTLQVVLQSIPPQTVFPTTTVTVVALTVAGSAVPDDYQWTVVDGAAVTLVGTGATRTFVAPSHPDGIYTVLQVRGSRSGILGPPQTVRINSLPQQLYVAGQNSWRPAGQLRLLVDVMGYGEGGYGDGPFGG